MRRQADTRRWFAPAALGVALGLVGCSGSGADPGDRAAPEQEAETSSAAEPTATTVPMLFPGEEFTTASAEDHGLSPSALRELDRYLAANDSNCVAVVRDGVLVHESSWNGTTPETDQEIFSATKSITAFLVGIAQDQGHLDIDDPVADHVPAWRGTPSGAVTIRNLLSNDSGRHDDFATAHGIMAIRGVDKTAVAVGLDQQHPPGTVWAYNNSAIQVLEAVLEGATGQDVARFAEEHLFEPIGMTSVINHDPAGNTLTFTGGQASCQDLARFGLLALNEGRWAGRQVVPAAFVREATRPSQDLNTIYGFLWWLNSDGPRLEDLSQGASTVTDDGTHPWPDAPPDAYAAQGLGGQLVMVVPSERLVVTRLGRGPGAVSVSDTIGIVLGR